MIYFADGVNIRMIDTDGVISTVIGQQGQPRQWRPLPCDGKLAVSEVTLHWPTALAINPLDDTLHILDNSVVLKLSVDHTSLLVVAGHPLHCPPITSRVSPLLLQLHDQLAAPKLATEVVLVSPRDISFSAKAELFIVESDERDVNRVQRVNTDGTMTHYAGSPDKCACAAGGDDAAARGDDCDCSSKRDELATKAILRQPMAVTVTPDNVLHVADATLLRVFSILPTLPEKENGLYSIIQPDTQERFYFNSFGQHVATKHLVTNEFMYNFTYHINSYYGLVTKVTDAAGGELTIKRDYTTQVTEIVPPSGQKCRFSMDSDGMLHSFSLANNFTTYYTYSSTLKLLETKKTSSGLMYVYNYDQNGRLREVIQPTGEVTSLDTDVDVTGALTRVRSGQNDAVVLATNGNLLSILHGKCGFLCSSLSLIFRHSCIGYSSVNH